MSANKKPDENQSDNDMKDHATWVAEQEYQKRKAEKKAAKAAEEYQLKQVRDLQWWGTLFRTITFRIGSIIKNSLKVAGHEIVKLSQLIPPINAFVLGVFFIVDMIEAIFLSKETREIRAVKATAATISTGLVIASAAMLLHPVTFPIASVFSTLAMGVSTARDGYFWYKASQSLREKEKELEKAEENYESSRAEYQYAKTQYQRGELSQELMMQHTEQFNTSIKKYNDLNTEVSKKTAETSEKKRNFLFTGLSFVGMALITLAGVAVAGFIVANPIALGVVGIVALGIATGLAIKNRIAPPQAEPVIAIAQVAAVEAEKPKGTEAELSDKLEHQHELTHSSENTIATKLTHSPKEAKEMLEEDIASLHGISDSPASPKSPSSSEQSTSSASPSPKSEEDEGDSEGMHLKK